VAALYDPDVEVGLRRLSDIAQHRYCDPEHNHSPEMLRKDQNEFAQSSKNSESQAPP